MLLSKVLLCNCQIFYGSLQSYGMSAWPLELLLGQRSLTSELEQTRTMREEYEADIGSIRNRVSESNTLCITK